MRPEIHDSGKLARAAEDLEGVLEYLGAIIDGGVATAPEEALAERLLGCAGLVRLAEAEITLRCRGRAALSLAAGEIGTIFGEIVGAANEIRPLCTKGVSPACVQSLAAAIRLSAAMARIEGR